MNEQERGDEIIEENEALKEQMSICGLSKLIDSNNNFKQTLKKIQILHLEYTNCVITTLYFTSELKSILEKLK